MKLWTLEGTPTCQTAKKLVDDFFFEAAVAVDKVSLGKIINAQDAFDRRFAKVIQHISACEKCESLRKVKVKSPRMGKKS